MNTLTIIPDVHGRRFWRDALPCLEGSHLLFLGDYLDPYSYEGVSGAQAWEEFQDIIALKKAHPERVTLFLGNHDIQYTTDMEETSRIDKIHLRRNRDAFLQNEELFQIAYETVIGEKNFLFTHAGLVRGWWNRYPDLLGEPEMGKVAERLNLCWKDHSLRRKFLKALWDASWTRWGNCEFGSPVWSDVDDMDPDKAEIEGYYQIYGHSQQEENEIVTPHFACLDCRRVFFLDEKGNICRLTT